MQNKKIGWIFHILFGLERKLFQRWFLLLLNLLFQRLVGQLVATRTSTRTRYKFDCWTSLLFASSPVKLTFTTQVMLIPPWLQQSYKHGQNFSSWIFIILLCNSTVDMHFWSNAEKDYVLSCPLYIIFLAYNWHTY